jgi:hypothetical protein
MENVVGQTKNVQVPNYSGVNIQIFNPSVAVPGASTQPSVVNAGTYTTMPSYPPNYYTQNLAQSQSQYQTMVQGSQNQNSNQNQVTEKKKFEKRPIVQLADEYIKTLESHLNNKDKKIRLMGAKEVLARLQEDESRKDDPALTALTNKMLQDSYQPVKFIAMAAIESRAVNGNEQTASLLQNIQKQKTGYGEDSLQASDALMKTTGKTIEKEFESKEVYREQAKEQGEQV